MLPSARRAELSRQYFDNSYLSRKAFEGGVPPDGPGAVPGAPAPLPEHVYDPHQQLHRGGGVGGGGGGTGIESGRRHPFGKSAAGSSRSRTTAGLTTFEDDIDTGFGGAAGPGAGGLHDFGGRGGGSRGQGMLSQQQQQQQRHPPPFKDSPDYGSDFSDDDSLGSLASGLSQTPSSMSSVIADSSAGQIWGMLCALDDLVLEVKANRCQCQRLGARMAALKKPMVAVHRGRQTADHAVLSTIKDLVKEAQQFMQRFLDPEWWRNGAGRKEDSEMFRELTFRLGFLMQAPPGFQEQSQEEDHSDRLKDYADLQATLEDKLRVTQDERLAKEIMEVLRRVRMRSASEGTGDPAEISFQRLHFLSERSLGNGGFGTVLTASLDGEVQVAVKKLNNQNVRTDLLDEIRRSVQEFHSLQYDFVVRTLGACTVRPNLCIVQERAPTSLFDLLHKTDMGVSLQIPAQEKAAMLYDIARGLQFLHIKRIVHGNLKSTNVLVFENNRLKVSDFGLICARESQAGMGGGDTVPSAAWTAPEVLDDQQPSVLSDVYSFGVLVHEVLTQRVPFAGKSVAKVITAVVAKGHRPGYLEFEEEACPPGLVKLADVCWTQDPAARPRSLNAIVTELGHIVNALGGDPRPLPYEQTAGESASNTPNPSPSGGARARMTDQERRIHDLEEELRALKMQRGGAGGGGGDMMSRGFQPQALRRVGGGGGGMITPSTARSVDFNNADTGVPEERKALRALYTATQGPGWLEQNGWETNDPDLSSWHGVICGEGGHVTVLQLPSNNLQGQIPRELAGLSRLKILIMSDNYLEGPIPPEFGVLGRLTEMDLSMNDLTGSIPSTLSTASSLERLCLQCNGFTGNVPRALQKLNNLKVFIVDWSSLCDTHPFRKFRKASPAPTDAEVRRAQSESRKAARDRAVTSARSTTPQGSLKHQHQHHIPPGYPGGVGNTSRTPSGFTTPVASTPVRSSSSSGHIGGGRFKTMIKGGRSSGGGGGGGGGGDGSFTDVSRQSSLGGIEHGAGAAAPAYGGSGEWSRSPSANALIRGGAGHWNDINGLGQLPSIAAGGSSGYAAPTAPYRGEDGIQGKAKAKAEANAPPPPRKWKNALSFAGKAFKDIVAVEMHPGFVDESAGKKPPTPDQK